MTDSVTLSAEAMNKLMPLHLSTDAQGHIRSVGPTLQKLRPDSEMIGQPITAIFDIRRPRLFSSAKELLQRPGQKLGLAFRNSPHTQFKGVVYPTQDDSGALVNLSFGISVVDAVADYGLTVGDFAVTDLAVEMLYLVEAKTAVMDELRNLNQRLQGAKATAEEQAFTDTLTGLKNRRAMDFVLTRLIDAARPFALMHLDLDFFKAVNDTHGHAAGDAVLQEVANVLTSETRADDVIIRYGGDEFVLILEGLVNPARLREMSGRIIDRLEQPIPFGDVQCRISGSIGVAISTCYSAPDPDEMLREADKALYQSKSDGRARATFAVAG